MRKILLYILILSTSIVKAQNLDFKDLPSAVKTKFETTYPEVKESKWGKAVANYEGEFSLNGVETSVLLDVKGNVIETNTEIKISELNKNIIDYLNKNYGWKKIKNTVKITDINGRTTYRIGIGVKRLDLIFDYQGNFLRMLKM